MPAGGHFWLVVSSGASLAFTASVLLALGWGLLHFRSLLSDSTFVVFAATSAAVASLRISGYSFLPS